jgi:cell division protein FtsW
MAVCLNLLPPKGIPLPFVSYGKTDLLVSLMSVGLLLNLSREVGS